MNKFIVNENSDLISFLSSFHISKANLNKVLSQKILVNNEKINGNVDVFKGDLIEFDLDIFENEIIDKYNFDLDIIYEDDYLLIVNKPPFILVHTDGNTNKTLANAVSNYYEKCNKKLNARYIHRLDFETSGLIVFAKGLLSHSFLNYQIENNIFIKEYHAIVSGVVKEDKGRIAEPIGRNRHDARKYLVTKNGKHAITNYEVVKRYKNKTLLKVNIETGRTHQIRVHLSYLGHPIIGDSLYGRKDKRLLLHASSVSFLHPKDKTRFNISIDLSKEFY